MSQSALVAAIRAALAEEADPATATAMQAYMKSAMPFRGVPRPAQKAIFAALVSEYLLPDQAAWHDTVLELWDDAGFREERYAAIALLNHRAYAAYLDPCAMPLVDHLVVTGAWWDYVDVVAIRTVGPLVRAHPAELVPMMLTWSTDDDLWRRRTAILHQVGAKAATNRDLLVTCIAPSLPSKEFFLRKATGWGLRDLAWHDPQWVQQYVRDHAAELSGLSAREALKNCGPGQVTGE